MEGGGGGERIVVSSDTEADVSSLPQSQDESADEVSRLGRTKRQIAKAAEVLA